MKLNTMERIYDVSSLIEGSMVYDEDKKICHISNSDIIDLLTCKRNFYKIPIDAENIVKLGFSKYLNQDWYIKRYSSNISFLENEVFINIENYNCSLSNKENSDSFFISPNRKFRFLHEVQLLLYVLANE